MADIAHFMDTLLAGDPAAVRVVVIAALGVIIALVLLPRADDEETGPGVR